MLSTSVEGQKKLDLVFGALSDATRRGILAQLAHGERNITELSEPYSISQPAVSKHLKVLEKAGLIEKKRQGRAFVIRVNAEAFDEAVQWVTHYTRVWRERFDEVEDYLNLQLAQKKEKNS